MNKKGRAKGVIKWLVMLIIACLLVYFAFRGVKWSDFIDGIKSCNFWWIGFSMVVSVLAFVVRGLRWRLVMLPLNSAITKREAYDGVTTAYLTNFALPRAGEFARCGVISATGKASYESVLGTVVLERSWDMISLIIVTASVLVARWNQFGEFMTREIWHPFVSALPFNALWLILSIICVVFLGCLLLYKKRDVLKKYDFFGKLFKICSGLVAGIVSGFKMKHKWSFMLYTVLLWGCYWLMSYSTIRAFPQVELLNGVDALFLMVVGSFGWVVPVQGGIGAYHFIISLAMSSLYGISQTTGVIFATISHESQALTMLICGLVSLISISARKR